MRKVVNVSELIDRARLEFELANDELNEGNLKGYYYHCNRVDGMVALIASVSITDDESFSEQWDKIYYMTHCLN